MEPVKEKTAEELLKERRLSVSAVHSIKGSYSTIDAMEEYAEQVASLRTKQLQNENAELEKREVEWFTRCSKAEAENTRLREALEMCLPVVSEFSSKAYFAAKEALNPKSEWATPQCPICDPVWAARTMAPTILVDTICRCGVTQRIERFDDGSCAIHYFRGDKEIFPNNP